MHACVHVSISACMYLHIVVCSIHTGAKLHISLTFRPASPNGIIVVHKYVCAYKACCYAHVLTYTHKYANILVLKYILNHSSTYTNGPLKTTCMYAYTCVCMYGKPFSLSGSPRVHSGSTLSTRLTNQRPRGGSMLSTHIHMCMHACMC